MAEGYIGLLADPGKVGKVRVIFGEECGDVLDNLQKLSITQDRTVDKNVASISRNRIGIPPVEDC